MNIPFVYRMPYERTPRSIQGTPAPSGANAMMPKPESSNVVRPMPFGETSWSAFQPVQPTPPPPRNVMEDLANQLATPTPEKIGTATKWNQTMPMPAMGNQMAALPFAPNMGFRPQYAMPARMRRLR